MNNNTPIKTGIAGLGRSGWDIHSRLLSEIPDKYIISSVFDTIQERQKEAIDKFNCKAYSDYKTFIHDPEIELVINALPSPFHTPHTIQALKAGKNVVCEKPMALNLKDADKMIKCTRQTGKLLTIFQNQRYSPDFQFIKELIKSKSLGRIIMIRISYHDFSRRWDWQTLKENGGGTLNNTCPHPVDQTLDLLKMFQPSMKHPDVFCKRDKTLTLSNADDHVKIILSYKDSPYIEIEVTSACAFPQDHWFIMGTRGGLKGSTKHLKWKFFDPDKLQERQVNRNPTPDRTYNSEPIEWVEKSWDADNSKYPGEIGFYLDLYHSIRDNQPLVIRPESVREQIRIFDECRKQAPV